jgi:hypothetical protein
VSWLADWQHVSLRFYTALVVIFNGFIVPRVAQRVTRGATVWAVLAKILCVAPTARVLVTFITRW